MSHRTKDEEEFYRHFRKRLSEESKQHWVPIFKRDERTDISKSVSGIEDSEREETEYNKPAIFTAVHRASTPVSRFDEKLGSILVRSITGRTSRYLSTPSTSELDEISHLREQNILLTEANKKLTNDLTRLTEKFATLEDKSIEATNKLREEITKLKEEIKFSNEIRTLRFKLPESWLEEDYNEEV